MAKTQRINLDHLYDLPCQVYWKDKKGIMRDANNYTALTIGGPKDTDFIGANDFDLLLPEMAAIVASHDREVREKNRPLTCIERVNFLAERNFRDYVVLSFKQPLYNQRGNTMGVMGFSFIINQDAPASGFHDGFSFLANHPIISNVHHAQQLLHRTDKHCLTQRQKDCLYYLTQGKTAKQIGNILAISHRTVQHHLDAVKVKYACSSRSELIEKSLEMDFIQSRILNQKQFL